MNIPTTTILLTNLSNVYLHEMKQSFRNYDIPDEDHFCEALFDIVNLYTENVFVGNPNVIQSFLYFQNLELAISLAGRNDPITLISLVYESLVLLLQTYTYTDYLNDLVFLNNIN